MQIECFRERARLDQNELYYQDVDLSDTVAIATAIERRVRHTPISPRFLYVMNRLFALPIDPTHANIEIWEGIQAFLGRVAAYATGGGGDGDLPEGLEAGGDDDDFFHHVRATLGLNEKITGLHGQMEDLAAANAQLRKELDFLGKDEPDRKVWRKGAVKGGGCQRGG